MNIIASGATMTTEELVAKGAASMEKAEKASVTIGKELASVAKVVADIQGNGVEGLGFLESRELAAEAKALAGLAANLEMELFTFHRKLTARAQDLGIDLPSVMSGSR